MGWVSTSGNLADVAPGRVWYEFDINYTGGYRTNTGFFFQTMA